MLTDKIAVGISVGKTAKPNEDCLAVSASENAILFAAADGHWGQEASELAVRKAVGMLETPARPPEGNEVRAHLYILFEQINRTLFRIATQFPGAPASETSLIVCYLRLATLEHSCIGPVSGILTFKEAATWRQ
jgi:serine/threonine protein phosphatase PrpC